MGIFFLRTAWSGQGHAVRRGGASLDGEDRSETMEAEGMAQGFGIPIVSTQPSILSRHFRGEESEKPARGESDHKGEKIATRYTKAFLPCE